MADEQLRTDEDVEAILRLAVQRGGASTADLRSRLMNSAEELGLTHEQIALAEEDYWLAVERERAEAAESERLALVAKAERKSQIQKLLWIGAGVGVVVATVVLINTIGSGSPPWVFLMFGLFGLKAVKRGSDHTAGS